MSAPDGHGVDGADHRHTAYGGPVMLDVGGDMGALVLLTTPDWAGAEIEISRLGGDGSRTHVGVHLRTVGSRTVHAAVYSSLPEGDYQLWAGAERPGPVVHVPGDRSCRSGGSNHGSCTPPARPSAGNARARGRRGGRCSACCARRFSGGRAGRRRPSRRRFSLLIHGGATAHTEGWVTVWSIEVG